MKIAIAAIVLCCIFSAGLIFLLRPQRDQQGEQVGFREWVKNPDHKRAASEYFAARESLTVPEVISTDEIRRMVDRLFVEQDEDFNFDRLKLVGEKAVPVLIETLSEKRTSTSKFSDGEFRLLDSPFERICELLEPHGPTEAVPALLPYTTHTDVHFRNTVALALGNIGSDDCVEPVVKLLDDDDDYVPSYAMMGVRRGIEAMRCTQPFLSGIFPALVKLLDRDDSSVSGTAPSILLAIDRERAVPIMLSDQYYSTSNEELHYILKAFNEIEHKIPHDKLLPLLKQLEPLAAEFPYDYAYAAALIAYSHHPDEETETVLRSSMRSPNDQISEAAADALGIISDVKDPYGHVLSLFDEKGWDGLSQPQQYYFAAMIYNGEVNNGGHSQYFVNSSGDRYKTARTALLAVGAKQRAKILADAVALFGNGGPSVDNEQRHQQLAEFTATQHSKLDALDSKYYKCEENINLLLAAYALENSEHFKSSK